MDSRQILQIIREVRRRCPLTNVYNLESVRRATACWETDRGFLFSFDDHGIARLGFFAADTDELLRLLDKAHTGRYYLEYLTKDMDESIPGLECVTRMKRLVNVDCRSVFSDSAVLQYRDDTVGEEANISYAHEINQLLWSVFHTEISHLLWDDELATCIKKHQITVHRNEKIDAVLMAEIMPRKFYINQVVNIGEKANIHAMLLKRLWQYVEDGGRYLYAWVEESNTASLKFHGKYGMHHDGMWNMIWLVER